MTHQIDRLLTLIFPKQGKAHFMLHQKKKDFELKYTSAPS